MHAKQLLFLVGVSFTESNELINDYNHILFMDSMRKLLILILPIVACSLRINLITTIVINEVPFTQTLTCIDCAQPVTYEATGLPDFANIEGDQLKVDSTPEPGQYHLNIKMTDADGQVAHLLLIVVLLD